MTVRIGLKPLATVAVTAVLAAGLLSGAGPALGSTPTPEGTVTAAGAMSASAATPSVQTAEPSSARTGPPLPRRLVGAVVIGVLFAVCWTVAAAVELLKQAGRRMRGEPEPDENEITARALASLQDGRPVDDRLAPATDPVARSLQRRAAAEATFSAAHRSTRSGRRVDSAWSREEQALERRGRRRATHVSLAKHEGEPWLYVWSATTPGLRRVPDDARIAPRDAPGLRDPRIASAEAVADLTSLGMPDAEAARMVHRVLEDGNASVENAAA